ncbi:MAG TPA: hypothetical protein VF403_19205, partial [Kofleriaceae bacterium]
KTQLLSDSQVVEVMPYPPKPPVEDKNDRSVWKGLVVGADEFAPQPAKSKGGRWIVIAILALAGLGAGAYLLWPKGAAKVVVPDATQPAIATLADVLPPIDASSDAAIDAAVPDDASLPDATVDAGAGPAKIPFKRKYRPPPGKRPIKRTH